MANNFEWNEELSDSQLLNLTENIEWDEQMGDDELVLVCDKLVENCRQNLLVIDDQQPSTSAFSDPCGDELAALMRQLKALNEEANG